MNGLRILLDARQCSVAHHGMAVHALDCPGLLFWLTTLLGTGINIRRMAPTEAAKERWQREREQALGLLALALLAHVRLLAVCAAKYRQRDTAMGR